MKEILKLLIEQYGDKQWVQVLTAAAIITWLAVIIYYCSCTDVPSELIKLLEYLK